MRLSAPQIVGGVPSCDALSDLQFEPPACKNATAQAAIRKLLGEGSSDARCEQVLADIDTERRRCDW